MKLKKVKCLRKDRNLLIYLGKKNYKKFPIYFFADITFTNITKRAKKKEKHE